jgi:hypothetical protein
MGLTSWCKPSARIDVSVFANRQVLEKADAVQIAGIANGSIGGKAIEPHK